MKTFKIILSALIIAAITFFALAPNEGMAEPPIFKEYQVVEVQPFEVLAAPDSTGRKIADEIMYQIRRYNAKYNLFDLVIMEGKQEVPPDKKVLLVKGTVTVIGKVVLDKGVYGYSYEDRYAVLCQCVDKASNQVLYETEANGVLSWVGNKIAKAIYRYKKEKKQKK